MEGCNVVAVAHQRENTVAPSHIGVIRCTTAVVATSTYCHAAFFVFQPRSLFSFLSPCLVLIRYRTLLLVPENNIVEKPRRCSKDADLRSSLDNPRDSILEQIRQRGSGVGRLTYDMIISPRRTVPEVSAATMRAVDHLPPT